MEAVPAPGPAPATAQPDKRPTARIDEFDVMRGTAIVLVVFLHTYFSAWPDTPAWEDRLVRTVHLVAHSAVPVFFFASAFLLARDHSHGWRDFASRKVRRIYAPLMFWMVAALTYRVWREDGVDEHLVRDFLYFNVAGQFYFVAVLLFFTVAFFAVRRWPASRLAWLAAAAFAVNLATVTFYSRTSISGDVAILAYRNPLMWVFSFGLGYWAGRRFPDLAWTTRLVWPAGAAMLAILAFYLVRGEIWGDYSVSYFGVDVFLFACLGLVVYPALARVVARSLAGPVLVPVRALSRYAFAIYLVHMPFFVGWLTNRTVSDSALNDDWLKLMLGLFLVGLASTLAFLVVVERLAPRAAAEMLALEPPRESLWSLLRRGSARLGDGGQLPGRGRT